MGNINNDENNPVKITLLKRFVKKRGNKNKNAKRRS